MSQKTDKKQYGFDDFIRDAKRTGLTAAQLAEALVAREPMEASCVAAWEIMKEQEGLTIDLLNFRAIWLAGRAYGLQEQPSKIPASVFASSGAAAPLVDIRAEIAILEAIRLPKAEPTIAIQELLDSYLPDDRETHWYRFFRLLSSPQPRVSLRSPTSTRPTLCHASTCLPCSWFARPASAKNALNFLDKPSLTSYTYS